MGRLDTGKVRIRSQGWQDAGLTEQLCTTGATANIVEFLLKERGACV